MGDAVLCEIRIASGESTGAEMHSHDRESVSRHRMCAKAPHGVSISSADLMENGVQRVTAFVLTDPV
jgi:hypothetical protein